MLAESGSALTADDSSLHAAQIALTYWYVDDPLEPRTISYSQEQHDQNWAEIKELVSEIDICLEQEQWPLTDNWSHCRKCAYQAYCGRQEAGSSARTLAEEALDYDFEIELFIEPESP